MDSLCPTSQNKFLPLANNGVLAWLNFENMLLIRGEKVSAIIVSTRLRMMC